MVKINVHSLKLKSNLDKFPKLMEKSVIDLAKEIKKYAKEIVPVDTEALKNSIRVEDVHMTRKGNVSAYVIAGGVPTTKNRSGMDYAQFVEDGTTRTPAFKYMQRSLEYARVNNLIKGIVIRNLSAAFAQASGGYDIWDTL